MEPEEILKQKLTTNMTDKREGINSVVNIYPFIPLCGFGGTLQPSELSSTELVS